MFATLFALAVYSFALIWIGVSYRRSSTDDYYIASHNVGLVSLIASTFTLIGGAEFVTLTSLSYIYGYWSLLFFGGVVVGFWVLGALAGRARAKADSDASLGLPDFFHQHFGRAGSIPATLLSSVSLISLLMIQLVVGGRMLATVTDIPFAACVIGMSVVLVLYVYFGGFQSVLASDLIQGTVMFVVMAILVFAYSYLLTPATDAVTTTTHVPLPLSESLPLVLLGACAVLGLVYR